jgi:uncharacterized LabA/DUF88 family protein
MLRAEFPGLRVDHRKLAEALTPGDVEVLRVYYYTSPPHLSGVPTPDERRRQRAFDNYIHTLATMPRFDVRLGTTVRRTDSTGTVRYEQKRVDLLLGIDMVRLASKGRVSEIHLVAGDSDFVPAVEVAKEEGVVCVLHHGRDPHRELMRAADECRRIDGRLLESVRRN